MNKAVKPDQLILGPTAASSDLPIKRPSAPAEKAFDTDRFDWEKDADCVVLHEQPATAIYHGYGGHVVIRQTNGHEDDVTILIAPENANKFMDGIADFLRKK